MWGNIITKESRIVIFMSCRENDSFRNCITAFWASAYYYSAVFRHLCYFCSPFKMNSCFFCLPPQPLIQAPFVRTSFN